MSLSLIVYGRKSNSCVKQRVHCTEDKRNIQRLWLLRIPPNNRPRRLKPRYTCLKCSPTYPSPNPTFFPSFTEPLRLEWSLRKTGRWAECKILLNSPLTPLLTQHYAPLGVIVGLGRTGRWEVFRSTKDHKDIKYKLDINRGLNIDQNKNSDI